MSVRTGPLSTSRIVMLTPGITAPVGSVIVPKIRPVLPCENIEEQKNKTAKHMPAIAKPFSGRRRDGTQIPKASMKSSLVVADRRQADLRRCGLATLHVQSPSLNLRAVYTRPSHAQ